MLSKLKKAPFLDPKLFPAFIAVMETENFTMAAPLANMTQAGVSQHISKLEEQLGMPLFLRLPKSVVITEAARTLASFIEDQIIELDTLFDVINEDREMISGSVSLGVPSGSLPLLEASDIFKCIKKMPKLSIDLITGTTAEIESMLLRNHIDIGLSYPASKSPLLSSTFFATQELILVCAPKEQIDLENIHKCEFVDHPDFKAYRHALCKVLVCNSKDINTAVRANNLHAAISLVSNSLGIGLFPRDSVKLLLKQGILKEIPISNEGLFIDVHTYTLSALHPPKRVSAVLDMLKKSSFSKKIALSE